MLVLSKGGAETRWKRGMLRKKVNAQEKGE
jgi:hypothetical protein